MSRIKSETQRPERKGPAVVIETAEGKVKDRSIKVGEKKGNNEQTIA